MNQKLPIHVTVYIKDIKTLGQKYSILRCLLHVKGLVICFYLGWSDRVLQIRTNMIKVGSKSWLLTCNSNITLSLPSYTGSALKRELDFCNCYLSLLYFWLDTIVENNVAPISKFDLRFINEYLLITLLVMWL